MVLAQFAAPSGVESFALDAVVIAGLIATIVVAVKALRDRRR
jgi:subtilase family serine protease